MSNKNSLTLPHTAASTSATPPVTTAPSPLNLSPTRPGFMDSVFREKRQGVDLADNNEESWNASADDNDDHSDGSHAPTRRRSSSGNSGSSDDRSSSSSQAHDDSSFFSAAPIPSPAGSTQSVDALFSVGSTPLPPIPSISFPDRAGAMVLVSLAAGAAAPPLPQTQGISNLPFHVLVSLAKKICITLCHKYYTCFTTFFFSHTRTLLYYHSEVIPSGTGENSQYLLFFFVCSLSLLYTIDSLSFSPRTLHVISIMRYHKFRVPCLEYLFNESPHSIL